MDFEIVLHDSGEALGAHMTFVSQALSACATWDYWDHVDRKFATMTLDDVPLGSVDAPFFDVDQCWTVEVWQDDGWVYVAQGDGDTISTRMKVPVERYLEQWRLILDRYRG